MVLRIRLTEAEADAFDAAAQANGHAKTVDWARDTLRTAAKLPPSS